MTIRVMPKRVLQRSYLLSVSVKEPAKQRAVTKGLQLQLKVGLNSPVGESN
jgi:hypothetical protein